MLLIRMCDLAIPATVSIVLVKCTPVTTCSPALLSCTLLYIIIALEGDGVKDFRHSTILTENGTAEEMGCQGLFFNGLNNDGVNQERAAEGATNKSARGGSQGCVFGHWLRRDWSVYFLLTAMMGAFSLLLLGDGGIF